jgi:hypothetical protein
MTLGVAGTSLGVAGMTRTEGKQAAVTLAADHTPEAMATRTVVEHPDGSNLGGFYR